MRNRPSGPRQAACAKGRPHGRTLRNARTEPVEHFGFEDGISQPLSLKTDIERWAAGAAQKWDPTANPFSLLLVRDAIAPHTYGSYAVYRKLEQDVAGFRSQTMRLAELVDQPGDLARAGALAVGRLSDGTPLVARSLAVPVKNSIYLSGLNLPRRVHR